MSGTSSGFVYALFDFRAGEEDEISFRAGERIDVLDKDDEYSDGWWRVRLVLPIPLTML